jgi:hypothetical protein
MTSWTGSPEDAAPDKRMLPAAGRRLSRRMAVLGVVLVFAGAGILVSGWAIGPVLGATVGGVGMALFLCCAYYWGRRSQGGA